MDRGRAGAAEGSPLRWWWWGDGGRWCLESPTGLPLWLLAGQEQDKRLAHALYTDRPGISISTGWLTDVHYISIATVSFIYVSIVTVSLTGISIAAVS